MRKEQDLSTERKQPREGTRNRDPELICTLRDTINTLNWKAECTHKGPER